MGACHSYKKSNHLDINKLSSFPRQDTITQELNKNLTTPTYFIPISEQTKKEDILLYYTFTENIKQGSFGSIREGKIYLNIAIELKTGKHFAVKSIWKNLYGHEKIHHLKEEIEITLSLKHEYIMRCFEVFEDINCIHMILQLGSTGDLLDYILNSEPHFMNENKAALFISQILEALHYLHINDIIHRDVKLENFLVFEEDFKVKIKLIDFGFATRISDNNLTEKLGSLPYMAPEIFLNENYNEKTDIWACGVMLYNMLSGRQPFFGQNESELMENITTFQNVSFRHEMWKNISVKCKDFIMRLYNLKS